MDQSAPICKLLHGTICKLHTPICTNLHLLHQNAPNYTHLHQRSVPVGPGRPGHPSCAYSLCHLGRPDHPGLPTQKDPPNRPGCPNRPGRTIRPSQSTRASPLSWLSGFSSRLDRPLQREWQGGHANQPGHPSHPTWPSCPGYPLCPRHPSCPGFPDTPVIRVIPVFPVAPVDRLSWLSRSSQSGIRVVLVVRNTSFVPTIPVVRLVLVVQVVPCLFIPFEIVKSAKILGVTERNDLKWNDHVDNITAKAT